MGHSVGGLQSVGPAGKNEDKLIALTDAGFVMTRLQSPAVDAQTREMRRRNELGRALILPFSMCDELHPPESKAREGHGISASCGAMSRSCYCRGGNHPGSMSAQHAILAGC